jgi:soluble lytic murein transglycosylase-like protein
MGRARLALKFTALLGIAGVAAGAAYGIRDTGARMVSRAGAESVAAFVSSPLPAAVVVAKKPTLPDIVDLILGDRLPPRGEQDRIASVLGKYTSDTDRANRIAAALVKEGRRRNIGTSLLVGVLLTENPGLDPRATSPVGARGLMQVMPFHAGKWGCGSTDLFDIESNICHGVAVLADNLKGARTLPSALLGYNGCVHGTNTPDCHRYPRTVYRLARKDPAAKTAFR